MSINARPWQNFAGLLTKQSRAQLVAESVGMVVIVGIIDYVTGYEVTIFPFYAIPILFAFWFGNRNIAVWISILSTVTWWVADTASRHPYSQEWLQIWDAITKLMFFLLVIVSGSAARSQRDSNRARIELLERSQKLEREIINISEREQQRIGRDLHDGLGQYLVAIGLAADSLKDDLEKEKLRGAGEVGKIAELLHNAVVRIRDLSRGLSPVDRDEGGLEAALEELATSASRLSGICCSFICDGDVPLYDNARSVHLYRIAQEALNNAIKHGHARLIVIALEAANGALSLRVTDDGIGLKPEHSRKNGMGFNIMRYRARMIGGSLAIQANTPKGTIVACSIDKNPGVPPQLGALIHGQDQ